MAAQFLEKQVCAHFKSAWPFHSERQEPGIGSGQPDILLLDATGRPGYVEAKRPDKVVLRPSQWAWHERWFRAGAPRVPVVTCANVRGRIVWYVFKPMFERQRLFQLQKGVFRPMEANSYERDCFVEAAVMVQQVASMQRLTLK